MPTSDPFPLNIVPKVNTPELEAWLLQFGPERYADASDFAKIIHALEYLYENIGSGGSGSTQINIRDQYNGTGVTVPAGFVVTRIISLNDINTEFAGIVTGTNLEITAGVTDDIYLIDGYTP